VFGVLAGTPATTRSGPPPSTWSSPLLYRPTLTPPTSSLDTAGRQPSATEARAQTILELQPQRHHARVHTSLALSTSARSLPRASRNRHRRSLSDSPLLLAPPLLLRRPLSTRSLPAPIGIHPHCPGSNPPASIPPSARKPSSPPRPASPRLIVAQPTIGKPEHTPLRHLTPTDLSVPPRLCIFTIARRILAPPHPVPTTAASQPLI